MSGVGIQLAPRAGLGVVFGRPPDDPDRFVVRSRYLRPSALLALVLLSLTTAWQLDSARRGARIEWLAASVLACGAATSVLLRKRLIFDRRTGQLGIYGRNFRSWHHAFEVGQDWDAGMAMERCGVAAQTRPHQPPTGGQRECRRQRCPQRLSATRRQIGR